MKKFCKLFLSVLLVVVMAFSVTSCDGIFESADINNGGTNTTVNIANAKFDIKYTETQLESSDLVTVLKDIRPSVVELYAQTASGTSSGSGVVLSVAEDKKSALIVTCHHVLEGEQGMRIKSIDGNEYDKVALIGSDPQSDIGVVIVQSPDNTEITDLKAAVWYNGVNLDVGTEVVAIGNPLGYLGGTVTQGIVSAVNRNVTVEGKNMTLIQTDAAINGGNSGGGLFDARTGALIGIVNAGYKSSAAQGLSFAIASTTAENVSRQLIETQKSGGKNFGYIEGNFDLGVEFTIYQQGTWYSSQKRIGISALDEYGVFAINGFQVQDIITELDVNGEKWAVPTNITNDSLEELNNFLSTRITQIGDVITVSYMRYERMNNAWSRAIRKSFTVSQYVYGNVN